MAIDLTHRGRVTHICVSKVTIIVSDNGLSPGRRQAIIWNNAGILLIGTLGTNFSEILIEILTFSFKKMRLTVSSAKRQPFCPGLNVLRRCSIIAAYANNDVISLSHTRLQFSYIGGECEIYVRSALGKDKMGGMHRLKVNKYQQLIWWLF